MRRGKGSHGWTGLGPRDPFSFTYKKPKGAQERGRGRVGPQTSRAPSRYCHRPLPRLGPPRTPRVRATVSQGLEPLRRGPKPGQVEFDRSVLGAPLPVAPSPAPTRAALPRRVRWIYAASGRLPTVLKGYSPLPPFKPVEPDRLPLGALPRRGRGAGAGGAEGVAITQADQVTRTSNPGSRAGLRPSGARVGGDSGGHRRKRSSRRRLGPRPLARAGAVGSGRVGMREGCGPVVGNESLFHLLL